MHSHLNDFCFILLQILILLIVFSFHPMINDLSEVLTKGTVLSKYIIIVFVVLLILLFNIKSVFKSKEICYSFLLAILFFLSLLLSSSFFDIDVFGNIRALIIPLLAIVVGWQINLSNRQYRFTIYVFILSVLYVILSQIMIKGSGFVIRDYFADAKNELGGVGATSVILSFMLFFDSDRKKILRILFLVITILLLFALLTIRTRTAILVSVLLVLLILFKKFDSKNIFYAIMGIIMFVAVVYIILPSGAKDYVYDSFFLGQENDVTSDRMARNEGAVNFLQNNLLFGNISGKQLNFGWVHNYPLGQLVSFGIVFGFFDLLLYLYLLIISIKNVFKKNIFDIRNAGYIALLIPFGISMAEPTFPFGPGTATVFNFILFGISLRYNYNLSHAYSFSLAVTERKYLDA